QRTAFKARDGEIEVSFKDGACGPGGEQIVMGEHVAVELGPLEHILFLVIMRHQSDSLAHSHGNRLVDHSLLLLEFIRQQNAAIHCNLSPMPQVYFDSICRSQFEK